MQAGISVLCQDLWGWMYTFHLPCVKCPQFFHHHHFNCSTYCRWRNLVQFTVLNLHLKVTSINPRKTFQTLECTLLSVLPYLNQKEWSNLKQISNIERYRYPHWHSTTDNHNGHTPRIYLMPGIFPLRLWQPLPYSIPTAGQLLSLQLFNGKSARSSLKMI